MAKGFDELVNFLLDDVALRFAEGESTSLAHSYCGNYEKNKV
jgi:hypothetical protein